MIGEHSLHAHFHFALMARTSILANQTRNFYSLWRVVCLIIVSSFIFVDFNDTEIVDNVFDRNPSLLDSIAVELDSAKRSLRNWRDLASKLIADGQLLREFEAELHYPSGNPTALLFRYLSKSEAFRSLTISQLKEKLNDMPRVDVVKLLDKAKVQGKVYIWEDCVSIFP